VKSNTKNMVNTGTMSDMRFSLQELWKRFFTVIGRRISKTAWCLREPYCLHFLDQRVNQERNHQKEDMSWNDLANLHLLVSCFVSSSVPEYVGSVLLQHWVLFELPTFKQMWQCKYHCLATASKPRRVYPSLEPQLMQLDCGFLIQ
jgi:hypothetical protein